MKQLYHILYKNLFPFLCLFLFLCSRIFSVLAFDFSDLYEEILTFDENGDLIMFSYDSIAAAPVTYQTIGWTIKRKDLPIDDQDNICVTIPVAQTGSRIDPDHPDNKFTYFYTSRSIILARIGEVSQEWLDVLTSEGEIVYLDAVMTVCHSGVPQGRLYDNGAAAEGEVYYTLEGILGARNWGSQSQLSLGTHFGKSVSCLIPVPIVNMELEHQYFYYNEFGVCADLTASVYSDEFEVKDGIPTSENLSVTGTATPYGYHLATERITGNRFYTVPVTVTYDLIWADEEGNAQSSRESVFYVYTLERTYSYRKIKQLELYYAENMNFTNVLLPGSNVSVSSNYVPELVTRISDTEADHLTDPIIPSLSLYGGTIDGDSSCPSVPAENFFAEAETALGQIKVKNDFISINGQVILSDEEFEESTPSAVLPAEPVPLSFLASPFPIANSFANGTYPSFATVEYQGICIPTFPNKVTLSVYDVNTVTVHTPVICDASISDDRRLNQQVTPDLTKPSLILGETFTVSVSCEGTHRSIKGYGSRNYETYALDRQIQFPFKVEKDGYLYTENTWISIGESASFTLPVEVKEGNYTLLYRTLSLNSSAVPDAMQLESDYANLDLSEYIAVDSIQVAVMGRIFDFRITDIHDYPRWEGIFSTQEALAYNTDGYYIGHRNKNGGLRPIADIFTLPVVPGSNPLKTDGDTLYLGYHFRFSVTTIGNFYDAEDNLEILCSYDYISKETGERFPVDLYYTETVGSTYSHLLPFKTSFLLEASNRTLSEQSDAIQTWSSEDYLPLHLYAVPSETILPLSGITKDYWLSNGYLAVNYHIYARNGTERYLDYLNQTNAKRGCCDMWQMEGFRGNKIGSDGKQYLLSEGDVIFYDLDHDLKEDYRFFGTH